jgi:hypothetical protein
MRTLFHGILLAFCLTGSALAQPMRARPLPAGNYKISGTVVNAITSEPIRRALVNFAGRSTLTDGDGHFEIDKLPEMGGSVTASKPGFFNEQELAQGPPTIQPQVQVSADAPVVIVKLTPEGVITGKIDTDGAPVEGIPVKLLTSRIVDGRRRWESRENALTDEDGVFRVANLPPGSYYVIAGPKWDQNVLPPRSAKRLEGYAEVFYPGVAEIASATPLQVSPGQQLEADFSVKPVPVFEVSGVASGFSAQGLSLQFITANGDAESFDFKFDPDTGGFHTKVPRGSYVMRAVSPSADSFPLSADLPIEVASDVKGVQLALAPKPTIPVNVQVVPTASTHASSTRDAHAAARSLNAHLSSIALSLNAPDFYAQFEGPGRDVELVLRNLDPGKYFFDAIPNSAWYVASAQCGDTDLLREPLEVPNGGRVPPIEVQLRDDGASFTVSVTAGGGPAAGWILLIPTRSPRAVQVQYAAQAMQISIPNLAPGDYSALAFDRIDGLEYTNPEAMSEYLGRATHVTLEPEQQATANLELIHAQK